MSVQSINLMYLMVAYYMYDRLSSVRLQAAGHRAFQGYEIIREDMGYAYVEYLA